MRKVLFFVFICSFAIVLATSCLLDFQSSNETKTDLSSFIVGTWKGVREYYVTSVVTGQSDLSQMTDRCELTLNADGSGILQLPREESISFTWSINNDTFLVKYNDGSIKELSYSVDSFSLILKYVYYSRNYDLYHFDKEITRIPEEITKTDDSGTLTAISVIHRPTRLVYMPDEDFDSTGMVVFARYSDNKIKDITSAVSISGFNKSDGVSDYSTKVVISFTENGVTKTDSFNAYITNDYVKSHQTTPKATYPQASTTRKIKVSFQYYHRNSTTEDYQPYLYSDDPYDDVNGAVEYTLTPKGVSCSAIGLDCIAYKYIPDDNSSNVQADALLSIECEESRIKPPKYINGNSISDSVIVGGENQFTDSYAFSSQADTCLNLSLEKANYSYVTFYRVSDELSLVENYNKDYEGKVGHVKFNGIDYPFFEVNDNNQLISGTFLCIINYYWAEIITVECQTGNFEIAWPDYLWGIDHFN